MERIEFLPLGTIVVLNGAVKKLMIAQRAVTIANDKDPEAEPQYFDYGAVLYPEGLIDGQLVYFNSEDIYTIIAEGYSDKDDELIIDENNESLNNIEKSKADYPTESEDKINNHDSGDDPFSGLSEKFDEE